jgi:hypothetical protein
VAKSSEGKGPDWWPREPAGLIFLARVVDKFGRALYGDDWTGTEAATEYIDLLPRNLKDATPFHRMQADILLNKFRLDLGIWEFLAGHSTREFSEKDWKTARKRAQILYDQRQPGLLRLEATQLEIVNSHGIGELELRIQPRNSGPWRDFNKDWWNTDEWRSRFVRCCIDPDYPNGRPSWNSKDNDHWIFATSQSVEKALKRLAGQKSLPDPKPTAEPVKLLDEEGAAKAKLRKPTTPAKKKTPRTRLISLMEEIGLAKSGLLPFEVREKVKPQFQKKHRGLKLPVDSTIDRAYEKYASATDTSAE